jgi:outer membrane protein TolC
LQCADLELKNSELELEKTTSQLSLSISVSRNALSNSIQNYQSTQKQLSAAQGYYNLIVRGYQEGVNSFIETVDARNQLRSAQLSVNINKYKVLITRAYYEFETASANINEQ